MPRSTCKPQLFLAFVLTAALAAPTAASSAAPTNPAKAPTKSELKTSNKELSRKLRKARTSAYAQGLARGRAEAELAAKAQQAERASKIAAAQAYLDAIVSHDASKVPFAANARRIEDGFLTGESSEGMREHLETGLRFKLASGIREPLFIVEGDDVVVFYLLDVLNIGGTPTITSQVAERFRIVDGKITQIEVVVTSNTGRQGSRWW